MRLFSFLFKALPFFSVLIFIITGGNLAIGTCPLLPAFFLIPVYYWVVFRPDWLPLWSLLGVGVFYDTIMGYELGLTTLMPMLSGILGHYIRPLLNPQDFILTWLAFALYSLGYTIVYGFIVLSGYTFFVSWGFAVLLYPLIAWGVSYFHMWLQTNV